MTATFPGFRVERYNLQLTRLTAFSSTQIPRPETRFVGTNVPRYNSPELDALIDRMIVTVPVNERNQVIGQILHHMSGNVIGIFPRSRNPLVTALIPIARSSIRSRRR